MRTMVNVASKHRKRLTVHFHQQNVEIRKSNRILAASKTYGLHTSHIILINSEGEEVSSKGEKVDDVVDEENVEKKKLWRI